MKYLCSDKEYEIFEHKKVIRELKRQIEYQMNQVSELNTDMYGGQSVKSNSSIMSMSQLNKSSTTQQSMKLASKLTTLSSAKSPTRKPAGATIGRGGKQRSGTVYLPGQVPPAQQLGKLP